ncbi:MAG TPA: hypothetical protein VF546_00235 [Pyrinomonadaceae bacterium]
MLTFGSVSVAAPGLQQFGAREQMTARQQSIKLKCGPVKFTGHKNPCLACQGARETMLPVL